MNMMKVSKWGNSLAVRLPAKLVKEFGIKEGDMVEQELLILKRSKPEMAREVALAAMAKAQWKIPANYKFDRDEANAR